MGIHLMPSEADEQRALVEWCNWHKLPIFHIPNGGKRNKFEAKRLKQQGVKAGVPDLFLPMPTEKHHGLFIELKRKDGGRVSEPQKRWLEYLASQGYRAVVCHGADEAIKAIADYFG